MKTFYVYMHITPSNKVYIGITSKKLPYMRWGMSGQRYRKNKHFWSAILKYGWDNILHHVIAYGLTKEVAQMYEELLIRIYKSDNPAYGYNYTSGGDYSTQVFNEEVICTLREHTKRMWENPLFRDSIVSKLKGHTVSDETRRKISVANTGRRLGHASPLKGRKLSQEHIEKLRGHSSWCKGKTKYTDERLLRVSLATKARVKDDLWCKNISIGRKAKYQSGYTTIWVNNGESEKLIERKDLESYLGRGFIKGRIRGNYCYVNRDGAIKRILSENLDLYLSDGWNHGRGKSCGHNISFAIQKFIYIYNDMKFSSAKKLALYLREHGYPSIASSTVDNICKGRQYIKYAELSSLIIRCKVGEHDES